MALNLNEFSFGKDRQEGQFFLLLFRSSKPRSLILIEWTTKGKVNPFHKLRQSDPFLKKKNMWLLKLKEMLQVITIMSFNRNKI